KNLSDNLTKAYIKLNKSKIISKKVNEYESGKKSNGLGYLSFNLMDNSTKYKTFISYIFIAEGEIIHQYNIHCSSIAERKFVENAVFKVMKK
ncbi:MAG: hypothetical protein NE327_14705, partial [Lentisphaeraceae bacterium]|nr:hypothetical protein [Lentisphaeraceae bacterium]